MEYKLLGQRIRAARLAAGVSQEQLAEMVGLTSQHISHTEVASTKISLPSLVKIANALHTSVDKLISDSMYDSKPTFLTMFKKPSLTAILTKFIVCSKLPLP